ncbi:MAG: APC family permease [Dehalococcoidia bacterium]
MARGWAVRHPFGRPLRRSELSHQTLPKRYALPVFASDNLSSVAYATEEILIVLALAGAAYFADATWISAIIVGMIIVLLVSYRQTIFAYPNGAGAYIVARDNLGKGPAQVAGAALLMDYILTVAVSISAGVANFSSGMHQFIPDIPVFSDQVRVAIAVSLLGMMWYVNKRGVRESGRAFSIPTYFFLVSIFVMLGAGFFRMLTGDLNQVQDVKDAIEPTQSISFFLLLRAFASGSTAVTGIEAISDGIQTFREPRSRNAANTMAIMVALVAIMFLGITQLAVETGAQASHSETVISQIGRTVFSPHSPFYVAVIFGTAAILIMAANTAFADFPRLAAFQAGDGFLPRWLLDRDNRLVFGVGITVLSLAAAVLIIVYRADVSSLIPLYAIGVFLSFTLSQAGMIVRWQRARRTPPGQRIPRYAAGNMLVTTLEYDPRWPWKLAISMVGAVMAAVVTVIFAVAKFTEGAWIIIVVIPALVFLLSRIHSHYQQVEREIGAEEIDVRAYLERPVRTLHILVVGDLSKHTLPALREFVHMSGYGGIRQAVHVNVDDEATATLKRQWRDLGIDAMGVQLVVLPSHFGAGDVIGTLSSYVHGALSIDPEIRVNVVITDWATNTRWWGWLLTPALHHLTGARLRLAFLAEDRVTVTNYRYLARANSDAPA